MFNYLFNEGLYNDKPYNELIEKAESFLNSLTITRGE